MRASLSSSFFAGMVLVASLVSCTVRREVGIACSTTDECQAETEELECVSVVDEDEEVSTICLPRAERDPTSCDDVEDCEDAAFPVDAQCIEGRCRCEIENVGCPDDGEVPSPFTCGCVRTSGGEGEFCLVEDGVAPCQLGLNCKDNTCQRGSAAGDRCSFDFGCVGADLACDENSGTCRGEAGVECGGDADCQSFLCTDGVCE